MSIEPRRIDSLVARVLRRLEEEGAVPRTGGPPAEDASPASRPSGTAPSDAAFPGPRAAKVASSPRIVRPARAARVSAAGPVFETVDEAAHAARAAFLDLGETSLDTRDRMIEAVRQTIRDHVREISRDAVRETGLGRVDDKVQKNLLVANRTPGTEILRPEAASGDHGLMIEEHAPYGVILSVTPSTNPSETVINNGIGMLAGGNATIFAPHPGAASVTTRTVELLDAAVREAGGPPNVFCTIAEPSIEATQALMRHDLVRLLVVTGGGGVVKEAMSVGKRAITAGPGNPPVVVDTTADLDRAAHGIYTGASLDNNIICTDEKEVIAVDRIASELVARLQEQGARVLAGREIDAVRRAVLAEDRGEGRRAVVNRDFIGKDAGVILEAAGLDGPRDTRLLVAEVEAGHPFLWTELMMPVIGICRMPDVDTAIDFAREVEGGAFHTASMYSRNIEKLSRMARIIDCSIFVKNGPHYNGLGLGGEGYTSFTIASPTGEGMTTARSFTRFRRCSLIDSFRIV
jgi:acyl-CoA reductase-like NAD-dependent aldehyde dehydrogenase